MVSVAKGVDFGEAGVAIIIIAELLGADPVIVTVTVAVEAE